MTQHHKISARKARTKPAGNAWNIFRKNMDGPLDLQYLRICSVHSLLDRGIIGKARAVELLAQRRVPKPLCLVELWLANPPKPFDFQLPVRTRTIRAFRGAASNGATVTL